MKYQCPVCGFGATPFPPEHHNICSCCGTEFGYHDFRLSHADLRRSWIDSGAPWFSTSLPPPAGWSPLRQINELLLSGQADSSSDVALIGLRPQLGSSWSLARARRRRARGSSTLDTSRPDNALMRLSGAA